MTVSLLAVATAVREERRRCTEIIQLCGLAGTPLLAEAYIVAGVLVAHVQRDLAKHVSAAAVQHRTIFDAAWLARQLAATLE